MRKGQKMPEAQRISLSESRKGNKHWAYGKKRPPRSEEWKANMSKARMGKIPWNKGISHSEEAKKKMSEAKKGKKLSEETKKKIGLAGKGKKVHTEEWKKHLKERFTGANNPMWKGGITPIHTSIRQSAEYKLWRKSVFERDNYTCVWCGSRNGNGINIVLQADHIKPFALFPELRFAIDNGRTLCVPCHKTTKSFAMKKIYMK